MRRLSEKQIRRIGDWAREAGMPAGTAHVICALSGGADSVFLLYALKELSLERSFPLTAIHIHHGIRGAEADRDEAFVRETCGALSVPLTVRRVDAPREARQRGLTLEEAGRALRREACREEAERILREAVEYGDHSGLRVAVALAHHMDDLAESVLFREARGTGVQGLAAMRPVSYLTEGDPRILVVRPLLTLRHAEILEELYLSGIGYCEDSTNGEDDAARNRIRHHVIPLLEEEVNRAAVQHFAYLAEAAGEAADFLASEADARYPGVAEMRGGDIFIRDALRDEPPAMRSALLMRAISGASGKRKDVGRVHIRDLMGLFEKESGRRIDLPHGLFAEREDGGICIRRSEPHAEGAGDAGDLRAALPADGAAVFRDWYFEASRAPSVPRDLSEKRYTKAIDYAKIKDTLVVRTRQRGDYLTVRADGARKSLGDYFTDEKVPRTERGRIPLVADGSEIVWVVGMRIGYRYRITEETEEALVLTARRSCAETGGQTGRRGSPNE